LSLFVSEFGQDVGKVILDNVLEVSSESLGHDSEHSQIPNDYVEVAVVDQSFYQLTDVSVFSVGQFGDVCGLYEIFEHLCLFAPLGGFEHAFRPFFIEFFENINSLR
jgi:hypothetical protein